MQRPSLVRSGLLTCTLAASALATTPAQANWPAVLSGNTSGFADSYFLGPPDDVFVGLAAGQVTFDFGPTMVIANRQGTGGTVGADINVYESGFTTETHLRQVLVSLDGMTNYDLGDLPR